MLDLCKNVECSPDITEINERFETLMEKAIDKLRMCRNGFKAE